MADRIFFLCLGAAFLTLAVEWIVFGPALGSELQALTAGIPPAALSAGAILIVIAVIWRINRVQKNPNCPWFLQKAKRRTRTTEMGVLVFVILIAGSMLSSSLAQWARHRDGPLVRLLLVTGALGVPSLIQYVEWKLLQPAIARSGEIKNRPE